MTSLFSESRNGILAAIPWKQSQQDQNRLRTGLITDIGLNLGPKNCKIGKSKLRKDKWYHFQNRKWLGPHEEQEMCGTSRCWYGTCQKDIQLETLSTFSLIPPQHVRGGEGGREATRDCTLQSTSGFLKGGLCTYVRLFLGWLWVPNALLGPRPCEFVCLPGRDTTRAKTWFPTLRKLSQQKMQEVSGHARTRELEGRKWFFESALLAGAFGHVAQGTIKGVALE